MSGPMVKDEEKETISSPIKLEDECFLGPNCLILPGVNIGYGSIISANSVIRKNISQLEIINSSGEKIKNRIFNKDLFKY
jgi:galactoside O-acetyltransferase